MMREMPGRDSTVTWRGKDLHETLSPVGKGSKSVDCLKCPRQLCLSNGCKNRASTQASNNDDDDGHAPPRHQRRRNNKQLTRTTSSHETLITATQFRAYDVCDTKRDRLTRHQTRNMTSNTFNRLAVTMCSTCKNVSFYSTNLALMFRFQFQLLSKPLHMGVIGSRGKRQGVHPLRVHT